MPPGLGRALRALVAALLVIALTYIGYVVIALGPDLAELDWEAFLRGYERILQPAEQRGAPLRTAQGGADRVYLLTTQSERIVPLRLGRVSSMQARTYLHVNCSQCHRPDGPTRVEMDFRVDTALADMGICGDPEQGNLGVGGAKIVTPGDPAKSILSLRMHRRDVNQMPPIATQIVDEAGVAVIDEWITGLTSCP